MFCKLVLSALRKSKPKCPAPFTPISELATCFVKQPSFMFHSLTAHTILCAFILHLFCCNLSFGHIIASGACPSACPDSVMQFFETVLVEGRVMLHTLIHPCEIHSSFPKQYTTLALSVLMSSKLTLAVTLQFVKVKLQNIWTATKGFPLSHRSLTLVSPSKQSGFRQNEIRLQ